MDYFSRQFNLSFSDCDTLERLNISYPLTLPPNKSMLISMTIPIPFTTQHKDQKCKGRIQFHDVILIMIDYHNKNAKFLLSIYLFFFFAHGRSEKFGPMWNQQRKITRRNKKKNIIS